MKPIEMDGSQKGEKMDGEKRIERIVIQWKGKSVNCMESKGEKLCIVEGNEGFCDVVVLT